MSDKNEVTLSHPGGVATFPILESSDGHSSVDIRTFTKQTGYTAYDPAFVNTASTESKITYIDGDQGILRYRGYPIEQLARHSTFWKWPGFSFMANSPHRTN